MSVERDPAPRDGAAGIPRFVVVTPLLVLAALALATVAAPLCLRCLVPGVVVTARAVAAWNGWRVDGFRIAAPSEGIGARLELTTRVPADAQPGQPHARVVSRMSAAQPIRAVVVVLALVTLWPSQRTRGYFVRLAVAVPAMLVANGVVIGSALLGSSAVAAAQLAGSSGAVPLLERWAEATEAGGALAIAVATALLVIAAGARLAARSTPRTGAAR